MISDKIAAANKINEYLRDVVALGGFRLKYRITVDPPLSEERDWERPEIMVEFAGPDSSLLLERGCELLRSIELLALEIIRLPGNEHEKVRFDCMNQRAITSARVARGRRCRCRTSPPHEDALRIRAHVFARTPHCPSGAARSCRSAN